MNHPDRPSLRFPSTVAPPACLTDEALVRLLRDPDAASDRTLRHTLTCEKCMRRVADVRRVQSVLASTTFAAASGAAAATVFEQNLFTAVWLPVIKLIGKAAALLTVSTASVVYLYNQLSHDPNAAPPKSPPPAVAPAQPGEPLKGAEPASPPSALVRPAAAKVSPGQT